MPDMTRLPAGFVFIKLGYFFRFIFFRLASKSLSTNFKTVIRSSANNVANGNYIHLPTWY
jgi:hypothetical protein